MRKMTLKIGKIAELPGSDRRSEPEHRLSRLSRSAIGTGIGAFTLVEMLIVLAIVGMIMAISIPFTSGFGKGLRIKTASRALAGIINVARSNAVTFRKNYSVVFDVKKSQYWIEDGSGRIYEKKYYLPSSVEFKIKGSEEADPVTFENDRVIFNPAGAVEGAGGSVTFTDKQGGSRTISVAGSTGKISID